MGGVPTMLDQGVGVGDGAATSFQLVKRYGIGPDAEVRRITRPEAGSVVLAVAGVAVTTGWTLGANGVLTFMLPPASGAQVTAGFRFDVPVRFAEDTLSIDAVNFAAGDAGSVALVEVREG
jgi:uncharacterized protein (TIGR02217 family)